MYCILLASSGNGRMLKVMGAQMNCNAFKIANGTQCRRVSAVQPLVGRMYVGKSFRINKDLS